MAYSLRLPKNKWADHQMLPLEPRVKPQYHHLTMPVCSCQLFRNSQILKLHFQFKICPFTLAAQDEVVNPDFPSSKETKFVLC
jgi:hypothetical protein